MGLSNKEPHANMEYDTTPPNMYFLLGDNYGSVTTQKMEFIQEYVAEVMEKTLKENGEKAAGFLEIAFTHGVFVETYASYLYTKEDEADAPPVKWFIDHNHQLMHILLNLCELDKETIELLAKCCATMNKTIKSIISAPEISEKLN